MRSPAAAAVAIALLAAPAAALASETMAVLAVADPPGPTRELADTTAQLRAVLAEHTEGVLPASALRDRMTGSWSAAALKELDLAYDAALRAYQAGDFEGSARALRALVADLETMPEGPRTFAQWTRAMLRLARVEQAVGGRVDAQAVLERLLRAAPDLKLDPVQHPPNFVRLADEVRVRMASLTRLTLEVAGQAGLRIFVNGRDVGTAPLSLDLPAGSYRLGAALGEVRAPPSVVDLEGEGRTVTIDLGVAGALRPFDGPGLALAARDRLKGVVAASALLGLDRAIAASLEERAGGTYLVGTSYDARLSRIVREARVRCSPTGVPAGELSALATFLLTGRSSSLVTVTVPPPLTTPAPPNESPFHVRVEPRPEIERRPSRALGWTAVGTGVATVALASVSIWQAVKSEQAYDEAQSMRAPGGGVLPGHTVAEFNARAEEVNRARSIAIGTGIGAGVALIATGVLGYFSYRQTGEIGPFRF